MPCCSQTNGLGQIDPATIAVLAEVYTNAKNLWESLLQLFGVGAGRREADVIVPVQEQVTQQILVPVGDFLERVRTNQVVPTCDECKTWLSQLVAVETQWLNYLHNTQWQDGRAAQQAKATLAPIFKSQKDELQQCVTAKCGLIGGGGGIFTTPTGEVNWPIVAGAAGILFALMRK